MLQLPIETEHQSILNEKSHGVFFFTAAFHCYGTSVDIDVDKSIL